MALCLELLRPNVSYRPAAGPLDVHLPLNVCLRVCPWGALEIPGDA